MQVDSPVSQKIMVDLMKILIPGVKVGTYFSGSVGDEMLVVTRHGGTMLNPITDGAVMSVQAYSSSQLGAERLAGLARAALLDQGWWGIRVSGHLVRFWREYAGPQRFTDPDYPKLVRFQFSGQLGVSVLV